MQTKWRLVPIWRRRRRPLTAEDVDATYARSIEKMRQLIGEKLSAVPEGTPRRAVLESLNGLSSDALVEELVSHGHPNPERKGCPSQDVLVSLARRERPIGDPAYDHLFRCSPCWLAVRELKGMADVGSAP
jgi:hypothetical protein